MSKSKKSSESASIALTFFWLSIWFIGIVLAKGVVSTFFAITTGGLWSYYLVIEAIMLKTGVI